MTPAERRLRSQTSDSDQYGFDVEAKAVADSLPLTPEQRDLIALCFREAVWPKGQSTGGDDRERAA